MTEHEDIARRLREEAQASAPADLLPAVMAEVRTQPRASRQRRRWPARPRWQPVAAWTAAAAMLVALGFGIAHLPHSSSSSAGSESTPAAGLKSPAASPPSHGGSVAEQAQVFTVPQTAAQRILGKYLGPSFLNLGTTDKPQGIIVRVPPARYDYYAFKLDRAQREGTPTSYQEANSTVIIRLLRARRR